MTVTQREAKPRTLLLVGDAAVGKTALVRRLRDDAFFEEYVCTGGLELHTHTLCWDERSVALQVADLAGKEGYCTLLSGFYHAADAILFVYDVANRESFNHAMFWLKVIQLHAERDLRMLLVGNKCDLPEGALAVRRAEAQSFAESVGVQLMETSARAGTNVAEAFRAVVQEQTEERVAAGDLEMKAQKNAQALALRKVLHGLEKELRMKDAEKERELRLKDEQARVKSEEILALAREAREKEEAKELLLQDKDSKVLDLQTKLQELRAELLAAWGEVDRKTRLLETEGRHLRAREEELEAQSERISVFEGLLAHGHPAVAAATARVPPAAARPFGTPALAPAAEGFEPPEPSVYDSQTEHEVTRVVEYEVPGVQRSDIEVRRQTSGGYLVRIQRRRLIDPAGCEAAPGCRILERHGVFQREWHFSDGFWDFRAEESGVDEGILRLVFRKSLAEETFLFGDAGRFERQARDRVLCEEEEEGPAASSAAGAVAGLVGPCGGASTTSSSFCIVAGAAEAGSATTLEGLGGRPPP